MRTVWLIGISVLGLVGPVQAETIPPAPNPVAHLDMNDPKCTVQAAEKDAVREQALSDMRMLTQQLAQTQKFKSFVSSRGFKHNVPMDQQMTPDEANTFGNLQEQTKIGLLTMMLEAKRSRDLRVFNQMVDIARRMKPSYQFPKDEKSEEYLLAMILSVSRNKFSLSDVDEANLLISKGKCSLENALIAEANRVLDSVGKIPGIGRANDDLEALAARYEKPVDRAKLSDNDRLIYDRSAAAVNAAIYRQHLYKDLLLIARLETVSLMQRDIRRRSQYEAPGDVEHVGIVWDAWTADKKISADQNQLSSIMNYINDKIPTDVAKEMAENEPGKKPVK